MVAATQADLNNNNEDARSTSSTLVSGEHNIRNDEVPERTTTTAATATATATAAATANNAINNINSSQIRHGFDQEIYEEDIIRFLYFSEKRHDTNAKPNVVVRNALKDWVRYLLNKDRFCILTKINIQRLRERIKTVSGKNSV